MFRGILKRQGIAIEYVDDDASDAEWAARFRPNTKAVYTETLPNPLNQVVDILDAAPDMKLQVVGHIDSWGLRANNLELSLQRARSVRFYLVRQSKDPTSMAKRVKAIGRGEAEPLESNDTAVGRSKNRRVEFVIMSK